MNIYSEISKELGWDLTEEVEIPSQDRAVEIVAKAAKKDREAFKELMRIVRFAPGPKTSQEAMTLSLIVDAFTSTREHWEKADTIAMLSNVL
jgi:hypothetical protein